MSYTVEHQCPQCGAPVDLEETTRLLRCPYCDVKNYLIARDYFRLVLPASVAERDIMYVPYLRFKGTIFSCRGVTINHRIVDLTYGGTDFRAFPVSLGFRPQAVKMKFADNDTPGSFLSCTMSLENVLDRVEKHASAFLSRDFYHRAFIGEAFSLIYLPVYVEDDKLYDALANQLIGRCPEGRDVLSASVEETPGWHVTFLPTICPICGWDLDGEKDSVVLTCPNCDSAWEVSEGKFVQTSIQTVTGGGNHAHYLPFWKIRATARGVEINSYADFIRVTNQPKVIQRGWEEQKMNFWIPAFKIRPNIFLHLARQLTVNQRDVAVREEVPDDGIYPVTLPLSEAVQSMNVILASSATMKKQIFPLLPSITFTVERATLVYLPFSDAGHEIVHDPMNIGINKKTLEFARFL